MLYIIGIRIKERKEKMEKQKRHFVIFYEGISEKYGEGFSNVVSDNIEATVALLDQCHPRYRHYWLGECPECGGDMRNGHCMTRGCEQNPGTRMES